MPSQFCVAVKTDGFTCDKKCKVGADRCSVHLKALHNNGRHTTEVKELKNLQKREYKDKYYEFDNLIFHENDVRKKHDLDIQRMYFLKKLRLEHEEALENLYNKHQREIQDTGVDPDQEARERREEANRRRYEEEMAFIQQQAEAAREMRRVALLQHRLQREMREAGEDVDIEEQVILLNAAGVQQVVMNNAVGAGAQHVVQEKKELAVFAADKQNIHRERTVAFTKEMVRTILAIDVPKEYKWNMDVVSKTTADIIDQCSLTPKAAWQMVAKYCQDESIYDLQNGVYGKVLDGVWQFILKSPHKSDLCKALKQEMEDNIGMCAQGNLSRLCNILSGYMDGVGSQESVADILGRVFPKLMNIADINDRLSKAHRALEDAGVDVSEWIDWIEPLLSDQDENAKVIFKKEGDKVTSIIISL